MKNTQFNIRISQDLKKKIQKAADADHRTLTGWIENLIIKETDTKRIKRQDLIEYIQQTNCVATIDSDGTRALYQVFIDADGSFSPNNDVDFAFSAWRDVRAFKYDPDPESIWTSESMDDKTFMDMIEDLIEEIEQEFSVTDTDANFK